MKLTHTLLSILFLLSITFGAESASLAVYNFTGTVTKVGGLSNGKYDVRIRTKGVLVYDTANGLAYQVICYTTANTPYSSPAQGRVGILRVVNMNDTEMYQTTAGKKSYTGVVRQFWQEGIEQERAGRYESSFLFGVNSSISLYPYGVVLLPKTAKLTGFETSRTADGLDVVMGPTSANYVFSDKRSRAANASPYLTLMAAVQQYRAEFESNGFKDTPTPW